MFEKRGSIEAGEGWWRFMQVHAQSDRFAAAKNDQGKFNHLGGAIMSEIKRVATPYSYSSAVVAGDYVFLGLHRGFGEKFSDQFASAFEFLEETLAKLDIPLENIVKVNVWLKDVNDLPEMERLFKDYFEEGEFPARMTSTTAFIDADCLLMIDGIAYAKKQHG